MTSNYHMIYATSVSLCIIFVVFANQAEYVPFTILSFLISFAWACAAIWAATQQYSIDWTKACQKAPK